MGMHNDLILPMPRKIIAELEQRETKKGDLPSLSYKISPLVGHW
jgi:hypothetical protein